jgi:hypothetical protein
VPLESTAYTWKLCGPTARAVYWIGELQVVNAAPSREHLKLEFDAEEVKLMLASVAVLDAAGPAVIVVSGGGTDASTVQAAEAGVGSGLPAASIASTRKVCEPTVRPV